MVAIRRADKTGADVLKIIGLAGPIVTALMTVVASANSATSEAAPSEPGAPAIPASGGVQTRYDGPTQLFGIEHFLQLQGISRVSFSDSGRRIVTERQKPLREVRDASMSLTMVDRDVLYISTLDGQEQDVPLIPDADLSKFAAFSPDERRAAVWYARGHRWYAGIYDFGTRSLITLDIVPAMNEALTNFPRWISNDELLYLATTPFDQLTDAARHRATLQAISRLAEQTWTGDAPSVTVVKSGDESIERPQWLDTEKDVRLVRVNATTGESVEVLTNVGEWQLQSPVLSSDKRFVAMVRRADPIPIEIRSPRWKSARRSEMIVLDLRTNAIKKVLRADKGYISHHFMWSPVANKILYATYDMVRGKERVEFRIYDVAREVDTRVELPNGFEFFSRDVLRVPVLPLTWQRDRLMAMVRPNASARFDWHLIERGKAPRNLTARLPEQVKTYPIFYRKDLLFPIGADLWRVTLNGAATNVTADIQEEVRLWCDSVTTLFPPYCKALMDPDGVAVAASNETELQQGVIALETVREGKSSGALLLNLDSGGIEKIAAPAGAHGLLAISGLQRRAVFRTLGTHGDEIVIASKDSARTLWRYNEHLSRVAPIDIIYRDRTTTASKQGQVPLRDALMLPAGRRPGERLPLVVQFYPDTPHYGDRWLSVANPRSTGDLNMSMFVGHGYAVLNAGIAIGPLDVAGEPLSEIGQQVAEAVRWVIDEDYADPARMAVIGGSYGGYGVASVLASTDLFKAGIALKGVYNLLGFWGTRSDEDRVFMHFGALGMNASVGDHPQLRMAAPPWADIDRYVRNSPVLQSTRIDAPLLLIHGSLDFDASEAERMFAALARQGKTVEFARYWGEGHGVVSIANIRDYYQRMLRFLDEHIGAKIE